MAAIFIAVMFVCVPGKCIFIMPETPVYNTLSGCQAAIIEFSNLVKETVPNTVEQMACLPVKIGEV